LSASADARTPVVPLFSIMPRQPTNSIGDLAKYGRFEELQVRAAAGEEVDLAGVFERAVADFRTVKRNSGHQKILEWCVDGGLDPGARAGALRRSILSLAAAAGNREIVAYMLRNKRLDNPFAWASLGDVDALRDYARGHDLAALRDENGFNLLFHCAESGLGRRDELTKRRLTEVCRLLLERGVSPVDEVQYALPIFPAFLCAMCGGNARIMHLLLESGGLRPQRFHLVLEHALEPHQRSGEPFYDVAACILQHGFDINQLAADRGRSLLHGAANRGTKKAVQWLLDNGADPNALDTNRRTPLHVCAQRNTTTGVIKLLLDAGSQPVAVDNAGKTALDYARENKRTKIAAHLESLGR
jgi:ankyrin repeat protein